ncbi:uncharacterized protein LOC123509945 isoform X2 [Portunus trituberculatus]|uniref:uncharacterized protein LOC123509945 isoform X2 n=1 Tax=Portunus trituberculatus TaxID=210409 RepID=UPI001E1D1618|nr:uncharacterized protein LOC123509945 isoform X2 [Portunus trituberculatus]
MMFPLGTFPDDTEAQPTPEESDMKSPDGSLSRGAQPEQADGPPEVKISKERSSSPESHSLISDPTTTTGPITALVDHWHGPTVVSNPLFVRSFKRRIRTRERRGCRYKTLCSPADLRLPERKQQLEMTDWAADDGWEEQGTYTYVGEVRDSPLYEEHDESDSCALGSPGSDTVFLPHQSPSQAHSPNLSPKKQEYRPDFLGKWRNFPMSPDSPDQESHIESSENRQEPKERSTGFSFLSRLGKSVSPKKKYFRPPPRSPGSETSWESGTDPSPTNGDEATPPSPRSGLPVSQEYSLRLTKIPVRTNYVTSFSREAQPAKSVRRPTESVATQEGHVARYSSIQSTHRLPPPPPSRKYGVVSHAKVNARADGYGTRQGRHMDSDNGDPPGDSPTSWESGSPGVTESDRVTESCPHLSREQLRSVEEAEGQEKLSPRQGPQSAPCVLGLSQAPVPDSSPSAELLSPEANHIARSEDVSPRKNKFFPGFVFHSDTTMKKSEAERSTIKDRGKKERNGTSEWKVADAITTFSQGKLRRSGALRKREDIQRLTEEIGPPHVVAGAAGKTQVNHEGTNFSTAGGTLHAGNATKSSQGSKTGFLQDKDEVKSYPDHSKAETASSGTAPRQLSERYVKNRTKRTMERSISVPFWIKHQSHDTTSPPNGKPDGSQGHDRDGISTEVKLYREAKIEHMARAGPGKEQRRASHKRARSQDATRSFSTEVLSLIPSRSSSHENLIKRDTGLAMDLLTADGESVDTASPSSVDLPAPQRHTSCSDVALATQNEQDHSGFSLLRDSRLRSASAASLIKKGTGGKGSHSTKWFDKEETPRVDQVDGGGSPKTCHHLYTSPYDLLSQPRERHYLQRLMGVFNMLGADSKMDSLVQQLDLYSKQGIPRQPHLLACQTMGSEEDVVLEDSWRTLVEGQDQLDERQEQQQSAIWELVETEATYIHMLKVITDLFLACLCNLQNESLLNEVDTDKLFSNIQEIYFANLNFWREHVTRMLDASRSSRQPLDPTLLTDAFYKFDELFHPYTRYCLEQSNCQLYCKEKDHDNEYFKMYLAWCETQKECNRLRLVDILVQPMQRLTKYSLLLKAILKKTTQEEHRQCLHEMITHVENFVSNVNSALRQKHEQERLRDISKRIEAYEAVEARDDELERVVKNYSELNLTQPMPGCPEHLARHLLHHGDLRLRDPHTKMDVHVFLFTDLLLITKVTQRKAEKVKVVRPPYPVGRLVLVELKDNTSLGLVSVSEWGVAVAAFTLQCPDQKSYRTWYDTLKRAKEQYREAQQARDAMVFEDMACVGHLAPRSPRPGSSRASRVSSLAHSHSGSIDLNETSPAATQHHPSIDMSDVRASSASSEDSVALPAPEIQRSRSLEGGGCGAVSPRPDRRPGIPKTPNTLSVTPPYATGQSLPNLTVESSNSLRVPGSNGSNPKALSPGNRGVSYPPPSPRTLRRSAPVPQSRNPPLLKTRHVTSMVGSPQEVEQNEQEEGRGGAPRRVYRNDRMDNRRYHTAGAIDDIKKQDTKDTSIHKRLSWNYGQGPPPPPRELGSDPSKLGRHKHSLKNVSCESVHSSSGVSSTSSLHRSLGSEVEALENIDDNEGQSRTDGEATVVDLTVSDCTSLKISPHISTTYICHDSDITLGVCSQYITQPNSSPEQPNENCENLVKIDVSEMDPGISSVQITVTEGAAPSGSTPSLPAESAASGKTDDLRMREILLNDASVEASDV